MNPLAWLLKELKLLKGRGKVTSALQLCHAGRLVGGLSISVNALPDEVVGPLVFAYGGGASTLRLDDAFGTRPMQLQIRWGALSEKWEVDDVPGLVHNLNSLFASDVTLPVMLVLGEWEDMWQLWALPRTTARTLLESGRVECRNAGDVLPRAYGD